MSLPGTDHDAGRGCMTFRFDTRDTKPKLRALLAMTVVAAVIVSILAGIGSERSVFVLCAMMAVYALGAMIVLLWAFCEQIRYNPYSYNSIYYIAFALFVLSVLIFQIICYIFF